MARPADPYARQRLLQAARIEFVDKGLDRAKVEDIARRAGLSKGAFYLHFSTKVQAFTELVTGVTKRLEDLITEALKFTPGQGPEAHIAAWCDTDLKLFRFLIEHRDVVGLILEGGGSGSTQHLMAELAVQSERQTAALLRAGMEAGFYRSDLDIDMTAAFIAGGYDRVARRLLLEPENHDLPELIRSWQRQVVGGVGTPVLIAAAEAEHAKFNQGVHSKNSIEPDQLRATP